MKALTIIAVAMQVVSVVFFILAAIGYAAR